MISFQKLRSSAKRATGNKFRSDEDKKLLTEQFKPNCKICLVNGEFSSHFRTVFNQPLCEKHYNQAVEMMKEAEEKAAIEEKAKAEK